MKQQAEAAEEAGEPASALKLYEAVLVAEQGTPVTRIALARIEWLKARSVNDFGPLTALLKIRKEPLSALTNERLEAFDQTVSSWPPGIVRVEAREFLADAWLRSERAPARAAQAYRALLAEPTLDGARKQLAATRLATIESDQGKPAEALQFMRNEGFGKTPAYVALRAQALERAAHPIAWGGLVLFALIALGIILTGWDNSILREALQPSLLLIAVYIVMIPCFIAVRYSPAMIFTYQWLAGLLTAILLLTFVAAASLRLKPRGWGKPVLGLACVLACLAAGVIGMEHSEMLVGFLQG